MSPKLVIPFNNPPSIDDSRKFVAQALDDGVLAGRGPYTKKCEKWLATKYPKISGALLTTSCTHALEVSAILMNLSKDDDVVRYFNGIDMLMTVGSEDLETYINVNKPITGIVQERPQFTNINNGIGLFSSRFTKLIENYDLSDNSLEYLKSVDGLDRNFQ